MFSCPGRRRVCIGIAASALLAVVFAASAWFAVHGVLRARAEDVRHRSLVYASTVASTVPTWVGQSGSPDLTSLANYAVLAGLLYIQVISGDTVLLEIAGFPGAEDVLGSAVPAALPSVEFRRVEGRDLVDAAIPYRTPIPRPGEDALGPYAWGTVRLGIDASELAWAIGNTKALAAGLGALAWVASSAILALALRFWRRSARPEAKLGPGSPAEGRTAAAGGLTLYLDEARLASGDRSIPLTPKQLDLLRVLMSAPGRTFSDEEILSQAWPGSPYADSRDVKQYVYLIRQRLNRVDLPGDRILVNVPGVGYRIVPPAAEDLTDEPVDASAIEP